MDGEFLMARYDHVEVPVRRGKSQVRAASLLRRSKEMFARQIGRSRRIMQEAGQQCELYMEVDG